MARADGQRKRRDSLWRHVLIGSLIVVLPAISLGDRAAWADTPPANSAPVRPPKINPSLPGAQTGTLALVKGNTVQINGKKYTLAVGALIQDSAGTPTQVPNGRHRLSVRYWLGTGQTQTQITQMIVELYG
jgi:hypothetical protein